MTSCFSNPPGPISLREVDLGHAAGGELLGQVVLAERRRQLRSDLGHRGESIMQAVLARARARSRHARRVRRSGGARARSCRSTRHVRRAAAGATAAHASSRTTAIGEHAARSRSTRPTVEIARLSRPTPSSSASRCSARGGVVLAAGKTAPLDFGDAAPTAPQIPIAMVPPGGFCRDRRHDGGARAAARRARRRRRAGRRRRRRPDRSSTPSTTIRRPRRSRAVDVPGALDDPNGLVGAVLDDAARRPRRAHGRARRADACSIRRRATFSAPAFDRRRAFHAAIALDATHVLVAGGCAGVDGTCDVQRPPLRHAALRVSTLDDAIVGDGVASRVAGDAARATAARSSISASQPDGAHRLALAGGTGDPSAGDRIRARRHDDATAGRPGSPRRSRALDGGALLSAFAARRRRATPAPRDRCRPAARRPSPIALAPALDGARLVALEDGSVARDRRRRRSVARYLPTTERWTASSRARRCARRDRGAGAVRLADGSVLVLGGTTPATASAWMYRPSLVGPELAAQVVALPDGSARRADRADPRTRRRARRRRDADRARRRSTARALVGGPRLDDRLGDARPCTVAGGGVALIAQQHGPGRAVVARLVAGEPARASSATRRHGDDAVHRVPGAPRSTQLATAVALVDAPAHARHASASSRRSTTCDLSAIPVAGDAGLGRRGRRRAARARPSRRSPSPAAP